MSPRAKRGLLLLALVVCVAAPVLDRLLSRRDRIAWDAARRDLLSVRDEILRFQHDRGELPATLAALVPGYLREDLLVRDGAPLYLYDPVARTIATAGPHRLRGLLRRDRPPIVMDLPAPGVLPTPVAPICPEASPGLDLIVPAGPRLPQPPAGAEVFEAETYSAMNYGWEITPEATAAGGAYIHSREGTSNNEAQLVFRAFDFHGVPEGSDYTTLRYYLEIPAVGRYRVYGRLWTTGSHCSNCVYVAIDEPCLRPDGRYNGRPMKNTTPFQWVWTPLEGGPRRLGAGMHYLEIFMHEDGLRIDQFMLSPAPLPDGRRGEAFGSTIEPTADPRPGARPIDLGFDLSSVVILPEASLRANVVVRRHRPIEGDARLRVTLGETTLREGAIDLEGLPPVAMLPVDLEAADLASLPRREHLLRAVLTREGSEIAEARLALVRPMRWEVTDALRYLPNEKSGPFDGEAGSGAEHWRPFDERCFAEFAVLDFGLAVAGNSLHAPPWKTIYARTTIHVPETATYLVKLQADDELLLWIDGRLVHNQDRCGPVTRSVARLPIRLSAGDHRVRIRVGQRSLTAYGDGRWQASLRFRTRDDLLSGIVGR